MSVPRPDLAGVEAIVVGLGVSGEAAARALAAEGALVSVTEASSGSDIEERAARLRELGITVTTGGHEALTTTARLAVVSPGIPPTAPVVRMLSESGAELWSEVELAYRLCDHEVIAVTGTNGKTTTTSLIAHILKSAGVASAAAGNIGRPAVDAVSEVPSGGVLVLEVSSFQLATTIAFRPRIAVVLNIAEDHTDWHGSFDAYVEAKARIIAAQGSGDALVVNVEDVAARSLSDRSVGRVVPFSAHTVYPDGAGVEDGSLWWKGERLMAVADLSLPGRAGLEDSLAAAAAALTFGLDARSVAGALADFPALPHRLQVVARAGGITFIDDSKATNPHAVVAAVEGMEHVVLIAGGRSKGIDLSPLAHTVPPVTAAVAIGEAANEIGRVLGDLVEVRICDSMIDAVTAATELAGGRGSVLLSPGCASLDMYDGYAARGRDFVRCVAAVTGGTGNVGDPTARDGMERGDEGARHESSDRRAGAGAPEGAARERI